MALNPVLLFLGLILCDHLILTQRLKVLKASGNPCGFAALRETSFPLVTVSAMASQPLPRHPPIQQRLPKRFSAHRRLGGPFPTIFPVTAVLAASSQAFPRSSPKWQGLSKRFPTHRPNGRRFRSIFHGYDLNRQKNGGKRMDRFGFSCPHSPAFQGRVRPARGRRGCFSAMLDSAGPWEPNFRHPPK
jgi:hypothetical protein